MTHTQKVSLFLLRVSAGWLFFYAGITKVLSGSFSAAGYLSHAKFLSGFYSALTTATALPYVNFVNEWALTFLGLSLILGIWVRLSAPLGMVLMFLYWLPLGIVHPDANSMVVDEHIILIFSLLVLYVFRADRVWGVEGWWKKGHRV